ncbi:MAG: hypothetical protein ACTS2F_00210 [Thainema sp.]
MNSKLNQQAFCPVCDHPLLRHVNKGSIVLFCTSCRQEFSSILIESETISANAAQAKLSLSNSISVEPSIPLAPPAVAQ